MWKNTFEKQTWDDQGLKATKTSLWGCSSLHWKLGLEGIGHSVTRSTMLFLKSKWSEITDTSSNQTWQGKIHENPSFGLMNFPFQCSFSSRISHISPGCSLCLVLQAEINGWIQDFPRNCFAGKPLSPSSQLFWLVVWNMAFIFHFISGMSSFPLTNSIIFQGGEIAPPSSWSWKHVPFPVIPISARSFPRWWGVWGLHGYRYGVPL